MCSTASGGVEGGGVREGPQGGVKRGGTGRKRGHVKQGRKGRMRMVVIASRHCILFVGSRSQRDVEASARIIIPY